MKGLSCLLLVYSIFYCPLVTQAQQSLKIKVIDEATSENLPGSSVTRENTSTGETTDANGMVELQNIPSGIHAFKISFIGYRDTTVSISIPHESIFIVRLAAEEEELEEIIVSSTRTNKRIEDLPLKVEVLGLEEMDEESALVPGNIASILGDLAVITIQRTNPINGNDAIRMQGLDPQYTLLAKDGLPLYGGFSGSLGVLSIPPLDLKQVEIIKGSVSTLYGGGAITGMINFISKEPSATPQRTLLFNASTLKERNINTFFSGKMSPRVGYTLFAGANVKSAVDVNKDGFSEIPEHQDYILHPRFFFTLNEKTKFNIGLTSTLDNRKTGDMMAVKDEPSAQHPYLRKENTFRNVVDIQYTRDFTNTHAFAFKTALSSYQREVAYPYRNHPNFRLKAVQYSSYSEVSDRVVLGKNTLVTGVNLITESFRKISGEAVPLNNYDYITAGVFAQNDWQVTEKFMIEAGVRYDHHNINGSFFLPRIALFYKASHALSVRLASGAGYKAPSILSLTDPTPYTFNNGTSVKAEHSRGVNADINYNVVWGEVEVSLNQAFYFADIKNPLRVITDTLAQTAYMENQDYTVTTLGTDTYVQMVYKDFELYLGYNHTEALQKYSSADVFMPFNPKDKFSTTFAYAIEGKWRAGIEGSYSANQYAYGSQYYFSSKTIYATQRVSNFWFLAAMVERKFGFGSIILNVENLTDSRQAKFESLYSGSIISPTFKPVWGPLDGRVFNLSVKVNL